MLRFSRWGVGLCLCLCVACGASEREEARALLEHLSGLDANLQTPRRQSQLDALDALVLTHAELLEVRLLCSRVHRGLLQAELEQQAARRALEAAEQRQRDAGIPPDEVRRIAAAIQGSDSELEQASRALPECHERLKALSLRFR